MSDSARQLLPFVAIAAQLFILAKVDNLNLQVNNKLHSITKHRVLACEDFDSCLGSQLFDLLTPKDTT